MASAMDVDDEENEVPTSSSGKGEKKRFEVKKVRVLMLTLLVFDFNHLFNLYFVSVNPFLLFSFISNELCYSCILLGILFSFSL